MANCVKKAMIGSMSLSEQKRRDQLEKIIKNGLAEYRAVGTALAEMRDKKLYRSTHKTFEAYCASLWGFTGRRGRQLMDAAELADTVEQVAIEAGEKPEQIVPKTEGAARSLREQIREIAPTLADKAVEDFTAEDRKVVRLAVMTKNRADSDREQRTESDQALRLKIGSLGEKMKKLASRLDDADLGDAITERADEVLMLLFNEVPAMRRAA